MMRSALFQSLLLFLLLLLRSYDCQQQQKPQPHEDRSSFEYHEDIEHFKETEGVEWSAIGESSAPSTTSHYNQDNDAVHNNSTTNIKNDSTDTLTAQYKIDASSENNNSSSSPNTADDNDVILARRRMHRKDGSASMDADEGLKKVSKGTEVNNDLWTDEEYYMQENADDEVKDIEKALQDEDVRVWRDQLECEHAINTFRIRYSSMGFSPCVKLLIFFQ